MAPQGEGHVLEHGHGIEKRRHLKAHADGLAHLEEALAIELVDDLALDGHMPRVGFQQAHDVAQQYRLAGARSAEDHEAFALAHLEVHVGQHDLGPEGLGEVHHIDDRGRVVHTSSSFVRKKSEMRIQRLLVTTLLVGALPTPSAPPRVR